MKYMPLLVSSFFSLGFGASQTVKFGNIDTEKFNSMMKEENTILLDVRTGGEVAEGMISNAIHIDIHSSDFIAKVNNLDKEKTYLVYCRSGGRSANACTTMGDLGFSKIYNLTGGYMAWSRTL